MPKTHYGLGSHSKKLLCSTACYLGCAGFLWGVFGPSNAYGDTRSVLDNGPHIVVPVVKNGVNMYSFDDSSIDEPLDVEKEESGSGIPENSAQAAKRVLRVGPDRKLKYPSEASKVAVDGDVIEIATGVSNNDYAVWRQNNLTIRGVGDGPAHLKSGGLIRNGKGIWITRGNRIRLENVEFSGAAVRDSNGAGIRHEGGHLKLHNTFFHHNEFSVLTGKNLQAEVEITSSRFWFQKRPIRYSHGIYIGRIGRFTLIGSHIKGTDQGHQVKTRARENLIAYNRIEDTPDGNSSRLIDLSNCGFSVILGNDLHQAYTATNYNAIGYGPEGCNDLTGKQMKLFVINNTFINENPRGTFVKNFAGGEVLVGNNLLFGRGSVLSGGGIETNNFRQDLADRRPGTWQPVKGSPAVDNALDLPKVEGVSLVPTHEFKPPVGISDRPDHEKLDAGSREIKP